MALYSMQTGSIALSASTTKTLILLNPVTNQFVLTELGVSFDSANAGQGIRVDLVKVVTLGSPYGTLGTVVKNDAGTQAATSSGSTNLTAEPATYEIYKSWFISPGCGVIDIQFPLGREYKALAAGNRIGIRVTTGSAVSPNALAYLEWEE